MKIGIIMPLIYMSAKLYPDRIFAPRNLCLDLCDGLVEKGHQVFLFSSGELSRKTKAEVISSDESIFDKSIEYNKLRNRPEDIRNLVNFELKKRIFEQTIILSAFKFTRENGLNILHCYHDTITFFTHQIEDFTGIKFLYNLHDPLPPEGCLEYFLLKKYQNHKYIAISDAQKKSSLNLNFIKTIYHGLNLLSFPFKKNCKDYFLFMGRLVPEKGLHTAIKTSIDLNFPLVIGTVAGSEELKSDYYQSKIEPFIKNPQIRKTQFIGMDEKIEYYQNAKALLFPIEWEEPFGMVLIEAMACGTPVIAFGRGSVPEIVKDGETGFVVDPEKGQEGFIEAAKKLQNLSESDYLQMRKNCRKLVEEKFSCQKMTSDYEEVYQQLIQK